MARPTASFLADPTIQHLPQVLREIQDGLLAFPPFQRPFVWEFEQRVALFQSVLRRVPIGTVMVWRTNKLIPAMEKLGSLPLPKPRKQHPRQYVLDGLQRLSTLYFELLAPPGSTTTDDEAEGDEALRRPLYVDLSEPLSDPVLRDSTELEKEDRESQQRHLALSACLDAGRLIRRLRELEELPGRKSLLERAEAVASTLRDYKIPIVPFVSDDIGEATRTFQLVNRQGTQMSELHMLNALSWGSDFHLLAEVERCREELGPHGWDELDEGALMRCFAVASGLPAYEYEPEALAAHLAEKKGTITDRVVEVLQRVAAALRDAGGIPASTLVPYSIQVPVLFQLMHQRQEWTVAQARLAGAWVYFTTYLEAFGGTTNASMIERITMDLGRALDGQPFVWSHRGKVDRRTFPSTFDFRHARSRALALLLAREHEAAGGKPGTAAALLAREGARALLNVIPSRTTGLWKRRLGARFLVDPARSQGLRTALASTADEDGELRGHVVSAEAHRAFASRDFQRFVELRSKDLEHLEGAHFAEIKTTLGLT